MSKVIVLTGATRGLGRALVPVFAAGGHTVIGCGRSEKQLAELWAAFPAPNSLAPLWEIDTDEFDTLIDVNVKGVFHVLKAFIPAMVSRGRGVIVNLSSGWGRST